jgi:hypothetical protein
MQSLVSTLAAYTLAGHHHKHEENSEHHQHHHEDHHMHHEKSHEGFHPFAKLFHKMHDQRLPSEHTYVGKLRHRFYDFSYAAKSTIFEEMNLNEMEKCLYAQALFTADQELGWTEIILGQDRQTRV